MSGETLNERGVWATIQASSAAATTEVFDGSKTNISTALSTGQESNYPLLDFKVEITSGTIGDGIAISIYRIPSADGSDAAATPDDTSVYKAQYVGSVIFMDETAPQYSYLFGVDNSDPSAVYQMRNDDPTNTLTATLKARARTYKAAS